MEDYEFFSLKTIALIRNCQNKPQYYSGCVYCLLWYEGLVKLSGLQTTPVLRLLQLSPQTDHPK